MDFGIVPERFIMSGTVDRCRDRLFIDDGGRFKGNTDAVTGHDQFLQHICLYFTHQPAFQLAAVFFIIHADLRDLLFKFPQYQIHPVDIHIFGRDQPGRKQGDHHRSLTRKVFSKAAPCRRTFQTAHGNHHACCRLLELF